MIKRLPTFVRFAAWLLVCILNCKRQFHVIHSSMFLGIKLYFLFGTESVLVHPVTQTDDSRAEA